MGFEAGTIVEVIGKQGSGHGAEIGDLDMILSEYSDKSGYKCQKHSYYPTEIRACPRFSLPSKTSILAIVRTADGNIDHWAFPDRETMEHDFDSILSWRDRVICVKEVSWTEGEGLSDKET